MPNNKRGRWWLWKHQGWISQQRKLTYLKQSNERSRTWIQMTVWWHKVPDHHGSLPSQLTSYPWSTRSGRPSPAVVQWTGFGNLHMHWTNENKSSKTLQLTVVLSSRTRLGPLESGVKVTILLVEYTGRRNSFPAQTCWTSSLSPVKVEKKVSTSSDDVFCDVWWNVTFDSPSTTQPVRRAELAWLVSPAQRLGLIYTDTSVRSMYGTTF